MVAIGFAICYLKKIIIKRLFSMHGKLRMFKLCGIYPTERPM